MLRIGDKYQFSIDRREANFDRACDEAFRMAARYFEIDDDGHSSRVRDWERSCCWIGMDFVSYSRQASTHSYTFIATTHKTDEEMLNASKSCFE